MHLIHHSSEEFNLPVVLRQNAFTWFSYSGLMLMPLWHPESEGGFRGASGDFLKPRGLMEQIDKN